MGRSIVVQPNGLFGCFSSMVDDFITLDRTEEEYIEGMAKEAYDDMKDKLKKIFLTRRDIYFLDWERSLEIMGNVHGKKAVTKMLKTLKVVK